MAKIKVVMVCHFSNKLVRKHLNEGVGLLESIVRKIIKRPFMVYDFAQWNTNAIREFEKFTDDVELHVISPGYFMKDDESVFAENGIHYYFFRDERSLFDKITNRLLNRKPSYKKNCIYIKNKIAEIKPDLVHLIGAEKPNYSLAALDVPNTIPLFVQLQTLLIDPDFRKNYPITSKMYDYRSGIERDILKKANYVCSPDEKFHKLLPSIISLQHPMIKTGLALTEPVDFSFEKKKFDFVYFALNISKAADFAIEAFAIACKEKPSITLDIVGEYSSALKAQLDSRIAELGIQKNVFFEGKQATHDDVIRQIKKSCFALLPLKIDLISGTVRESMANGLPVVTTITPDTPKLNAQRESVLLSPIGDHKAMAENMLKLLNDVSFAKKIQENAGITASERSSNEQVIRKWIAAYHACIENFKNGTPIPQELLS
ncbi:glycosyltransferase family 4 protein [Fibrobacter succinogenes]|uniref:Glycosyltransferase involved in cell wall bisynthesis n=1 Tax=Fibrobacter succinogenes TaxID=833 RepID=A0A380S713_FIBSU|nr:glycosyltransferase family 4 protein [Fibrobacter succinogenes]PWJ34876.1 glycosyltransferase involved in cell wall biosynthesis [Fibrobacter succinogenes subsp. elongatus]SUQ24999.1 Glycosyltransferase involved in cell wall bisynthesis [Fibrobacter succinogenes]